MTASDKKIFIARAPVRVDVAGGSDAPPFSVEYGGGVLNFAITQFVHATLEVDPSNPQLTIRSEDFSKTIEAENLDALEFNGELDFIKGIAKRMTPNWGFQLSVESDVPPGSGLGSSGAVGVACVKAFDLALGNNRSQEDTADLGNSIERDDLGFAGGCQDSYGAALGGIKFVHCHQGGGVSIERVHTPDGADYELERRAVLVYTGEVHLSGSIHSDIKRGYELPNSPTVDAMKNLKRVAFGAKEALEKGDIDKFGQWLSESWVHHKRLHDSCNSEVLEKYFAAAEGLVPGGRVCGAGGGGCAFFIAKEGRRRKLEQAFAELGGKLIPFRIDPTGVVGWKK